MNSKITTPLLGVALVLATSGLASATTSYSFNFGSAPNGSNQTLSNFACTGTGCGVTVTATAWWIDGQFSGSTFTPGTTTGGVFTANSNTKAVKEDLGIYAAGLGTCNSTDPGWNSSTGDCTAPYHAIDNAHGLDFILLTFSTAVNIDSLTLTNFGALNGSANPDADMTYFLNQQINTNTVFSSLAASGNKANDLTGQGTCTGGCAVTDGSLGWTGVTNLIVAASTTLDSNYDNFKLTSVSGTTGNQTSATPEPASMLLIGSGLLGIGATLRRRKSQVK